MITRQDPSFSALAQQQPASAPQPKVVKSHALLMGEREIHIAHGGEVYRLTVTRQGKLILTK